MRCMTSPDRAGAKSGRSYGVLVPNVLDLMRSGLTGHVVQFHHAAHALLRGFPDHAHVAAHVISPSKPWINIDFICQS
jgi:hypothetical protein